MWIKLEGGAFDNPKMQAAGPLARELYFAALCWSGEHLTDGIIPGHMVPLLAAKAGVRPALRARLVEVGLWIDLGDDGLDAGRTPRSRGPVGDVAIKDYLEYNPSRAATEDRRAALRKAGRKGAQQRWGFNDDDLADGY